VLRVARTLAPTATVSAGRALAGLKSKMISATTRREAEKTAVQFIERRNRMNLSIFVFLVVGVFFGVDYA
jgi:hypothetical protein